MDEYYINGKLLSLRTIGKLMRAMNDNDFITIADMFDDLVTTKSGIRGGDLPFEDLAAVMQRIVERMKPADPK